MTAAIVLLLLGGVIGALVIARRDRRQRLLRDLASADRRLGFEHSKARRAMNDAAGQSWRNLADGGPRG